MTSSQSNPFVLPGMGQTADMAGNPLLASMEMMRQAWTALAGPGGLAQAMPMTPPMSPEDLERRITELRSVENWLRMNLSMLSSTIQGLEVQRATIATLRSFVDGAAAMPGAPGASPLDVVLGLKPAGRSEAAKPDKRAPAGSPGTAESGPAASADAPSPEDAAGSPEPSAGGGPAGSGWSQASQSASQAWWNLLQQQFGQLAAATAATMPEVPPAPSPPAGAAAAPARKRAPRKRAAPKPASGGKGGSGKASSD